MRERWNVAAMVIDGGTERCAVLTCEEDRREVDEVGGVWCSRGSNTDSITNGPKCECLSWATARLTLQWSQVTDARGTWDNYIHLPLPPYALLRGFQS